MTTYNNKTLNYYKPKSGGKNKSDVDGFYSNSDNEHFFIKKPADKGELFTELFAGLLLQEFKNRKLIDEIYFPSLICADVIRFDDGSYGLIQPLVSFDELHKVIGTSYSDGSDRDPTKEALFGPSYYTGVTKMGDSFGLSISLMFSLLLGAHSVHSGNIVVLRGDEESKSRQYGRIDWGDAFRYFAHDRNNEDILYAYENRGIFNIKSLTKDYFLNYKKINGLFPAMADKAQKILPQLSEELLTDIVSSALKKIPADLIDKDTQEKLATYMVMPSFKDITFGPEGTSELFATEMGNLLERRLTSISKLQDLQAKVGPENMYASVILRKPIKLTIEDSMSFPDTLKQWNHSLTRRASIESDNLDLIQLTKCFNQYVSYIAEQTETDNLWHQNPSNNYNIFMPHHSGDSKQVHGHAFVPQYKESSIIKRFFTLNTQAFGAFRFAAFEQSINDYSKANQESDWVKIQTLLQTGQLVIKTLDILNKAREFGMDEAVLNQTEHLKVLLEAFEKAETEVQHLLETPRARPSLEQRRDSSFFYPVEDQELSAMTGDQLATICLEELNSSDASPLVERIIKNDRLWYRMDESFETGVYNSRLDGSVEKIAALRDNRALITASQEKTGQQISELENQIKLLSGQVSTRTEAAAQLNDALLKQLESTHSLQEHVKELKLQITQAQVIKDQLDQVTNQMKPLQQQLENAREQEQSLLDEHQKELSTVQEQVKTQQLLMAQLKEQLHSLEEANATLKSTLTVENENRTLAEQSVRELQDELNQLQPELERIKLELHEVMAESSTSSHKIQELLTDVASKQILLEQAEEKLQRLDAIKIQHQTELSQLKQETEHSIQLLTEELKGQKAQFEALQTQLDTKDQTILELRQKLKETASESRPSKETDAPTSEELKKDAKNKLVQEQLGKTISLLINEQKRNKAEISRLQQLIQSSNQAQKNYENALKDRKDIYFARMERMLPIMRQIQGIEHKADELEEREETTASQEAYKLANRLRADIKEYAESEEKNEDVALNNFKIKAVDTVSKSKEILGQHRDGWKYILANITLGILLVGVGYAAAILINKQVTGNYTFFSKTESIKQVEEVEQSIVSKTIQPLSGG